MIANVLHGSDLSLSSILTGGSDFTNNLQDSHSHEPCISGDNVIGDRGMKEITSVLLDVSKVIAIGITGVAGA